MEKVAVQKCEAYNNNDFSVQVKKLISMLGGIEEFVKPGQTVLLKVNLLMGKPPEAAVTTHPLVVKEVAKLVMEAGGKVIIGDSPGGIFRANILARAYKASGLTQIAEEVGATLNFQTDHEKHVFHEGEVCKSFELGKFITDVDIIINLPKLKTHGMTMYTGAVKNLFGAIPGLLKGEYHLKMPAIDLFSRMLLDLYLLIKPNLNIMDGIMGMEGEGPSNGTPRNFGYLMASSSAIALDVAAVKLLGIKPATKVPLILVAKERGLVSDIKEINLLGDELLAATDVDIPVIEKNSNLLDQKLPKPVSEFLQSWLRPRPVFDQQKCVGCEDCYKNCPPKTIEMVANKPVVDMDNCIRCFCCQELCKHDAVEIKRPLLGKLIFR